MDRADLGVMQQGALLLQMHIAGILRQLFLQRGADSFFHFSGSRPCKGNNQKLIQIDRMFRIRNQRQNTLYQYRGFPGTGRSRNKKIFSSQADDCLLFFRPFHAHRWFSS